MGLMTDEPKRIYLFRTGCVADGRETVMCAASADLVVAVYGGDGHQNQEGVQRAFGGNTFYRNDETGECFIGVWGARNASRFRTAIRSKATVVIVHEPPPARLAWWNTNAFPPPISTQCAMD
jgi:hypothetical protein